MESEDHLINSDSERSPTPSDSFTSLEDSLELPPAKGWRYYRDLLWNGPLEPRDDYPERFRYLSFVESIPDKFYNKTTTTSRAVCLVVYVAVWLLLWHSILSPFLTIPPAIKDDPDTTIYTLGCTSQFWKGKNAACGPNDEQCPVFKDLDKDVYVRCPALCDRSWTYSLLPIGDQRIKYRSFNVGGGEHKTDEDLSRPYRADSYICGSAVHAGVLSPFYGGCARLSYSSGEQPGFRSAKGHYGVEDSIEFDSFFPSSFFFKKKPRDKKFAQCYDPRLPVLLMNILLGIPVVFLASGIVTYWVINSVGFWTISLATDPPYQVDSNDLESYSHLLSMAIQRFLPSCFILYALWSCSTHITLSEPQGEKKLSYLSRLFYFYPSFWLGVLNNISFDRLPVDRLTISDLKEQPNGFIAVGCLIIFITACALVQAYKIWQAGKFRRYLGIYVSFVLGLIVVANLPGLHLRIHHYFLAMLFIPGCCTRGATALMFQGILLGLFLSGAARWGLAAIAETLTVLRRDDPSGRIIPPMIEAYNASSGVLSWIDETWSQTKDFNGISLLINDVERFVGANITNVNLREVISNSSDLTKSVQHALKSSFVAPDKTIPLYLRLGKKVLGTSNYSDFTNAALLRWPSGNLTLPKPGIT